jgi:hypothetical protein
MSLSSVGNIKNLGLPINLKTDVKTPSKGPLSDIVPYEQSCQNGRVAIARGE